jgi:outer membrane murein-binding lipoprotein Lpp
MIGSSKKRRARSVEDFLKDQDAETLSVNSSAAGNEAGVPRTKRWFVAPVIVAGCLLVLLFVAFAKINGLKSDIAQLRLESNRESVETLKAQVAALGSKVESADEEAVQLKANIASLEKDLGAMKLMDVQRQKAEAAAKKKAVDKKKPVKPTRRST